MLTLLQQLPPDVARNQGVAVLVNAMPEVLAGNTNTAASAVLQLLVVHIAPPLHNPSASVQLYSLGLVVAVNRLQKGVGSGLTTCPGTRFRISAIDLSVTTGNQMLLDIHPISKQLSNSAAIPIGVDTPDGDCLPLQVAAQIIPSCLGWHWISISPTEFCGIDTSKPDLLSCARSACVAVVARSDKDRGKGSKKHQSSLICSFLMRSSIAS